MSLYPVIVVGGVVIVVYGIFGKRPFYNDVEVPLSKEEREDMRPPTRLERVGYIGFGAAMIVFGVWKLISPG